MAMPPRSAAEKEASAPDSLPIGSPGAGDDDGSGRAHDLDRTAFEPIRYRSVASDGMEAILEAIQNGASGEEHRQPAAAGELPGGVRPP